VAEYGPEHRRLRELWRPLVEAGGVPCHAVVCLEPSRLIVPGSLWDLGHSAGRDRWTGPEHQRCNRTEGSRRGAARWPKARGPLGAWRTTQRW
jgi:hypothetical protein